MEDALWERLRRALAGYHRRRLEQCAARPAAVLVPLYEENRAVHVVLIRRTDRVEAHRGQIAFPGGMMDEGDPGPVSTALRESLEEIGLSPEHVELLGLLDDHITSTGYRITPVVGRILLSPYPFRANPEEVAELFCVPLTWFLRPEHLMVRSIRRGDEPLTDYVWHYQGRTIWGATGRILKSLVDLLRRSPG